MRSDVAIDEQRFRALFESSAEVLGGLVKPIEQHEKQNKAASRD